MKRFNGNQENEKNCAWFWFHSTENKERKNIL